MVTVLATVLRLALPCLRFSPHWQFEK